MNAIKSKLKQVEQLASSKANLIDANAATVRRVAVAGLTLDYTKSLLDDDVMASLTELADMADLPARFDAMFSGKKINHTEQRAVLHAALRDPDTKHEQVRKEMKRMLDFADQVASADFKLPSGNAVKSILHIGIGGSYLGPKLYYEAFPKNIECRFVANIDPAAISEAVSELDPASTLVVSVSKSGTTTETLANTQEALDWIAMSSDMAQAQGHLAVVSTNPDMAAKLNCPSGQSFALWDWVGGRYSVWSTVSLSVAAACGTKAFRDFLDGAHEMDCHARSTTGFGNLPVTLALLRVWHALCCDAQTHCVVAYQHRLRSLPAYLQQLVMESNGKSTADDGTRPSNPTSAVWWGGEGTNDQHSYYQLLLQGMRRVPADFIVALHAQSGEDETMQRHLLANALGQSRALFFGRDLAASKKQLIDAGIDDKRASELAPHLVVPGNQPVNLMIFEQLTPRILGSLLAAYEHMTATLGWLWQINSFDQWGVELGKINFRQVLKALEGESADGMDASTREVIEGLR